MTKFQVILIIIFIVFIIVGVAAFATYKGNTAGGSQSISITVWGTFPAEAFTSYVAKINEQLPQAMTVNYRQEDPAAFSQDFINALARGQGPDAILISADMLVPQESKIAPIPYATMSQRAFLDTYVSEAGIYTSANGILAVPFTIDPLIMYWNRDMFDAAGIASYPRYWDEFTTKNGLISKLTVKDQNGNIRKSALSMGDFTNTDNAREVLGTLFLQSGNPVTMIGTGGLISAMKTGGASDPTAALQFFTQFVDPNNANYSWNRAQSDSKSAFLSGILATYFGFASEIQDLRAKNPNLNFDAAALPQARSGGTPAVYGRMFGFSLVRASPNVNAAYQAVTILTSPAYLPMLSQALYLPSVRRDIIAQGSTDPYITIFNSQALIARTWLDAGAAYSTQIFGNMVDWITSGQKTVNQAVQDGGNQYNVLLEQAVAQ